MSEQFSMAGYNASLDSQNIIGQLVWWTIYRQRRLIDDVESKMESLGLDPKVLNKSTDKANFIHATASVAKKYQATLFKILDDSTHIVFKIASAVPNKEKEEMEIDQHTTISYSKVAKMVNGKGKEDIIKEIRDTFNSYQNSVSDDNIRNTLKFILDNDCGAINLRPMGGIYFVAKDAMDTVLKLDNLVTSLGMGKIFPLRVPESKSEKEVVLTSAAEDCEGRLDLISKEVEAITSRISSLENASERAKNVMNLYDKLCSAFDYRIEAEDMLKRIQSKFDSLEEQITRKIEECSEKKVLKK